MSRTRHNPDMTTAQLAQVARQMGKASLAALLERGGPAAEAVAAEIRAALDEPAADEETLIGEGAEYEYARVGEVFAVGSRKYRVTGRTMSGIGTAKGSHGGLKVYGIAVPANTPVTGQTRSDVERSMSAPVAPALSRGGISDRSGAPRALSDREAWLELASLVPQAFADQPEPVRRAIVEAFRAQAA